MEKIIVDKVIEIADQNEWSVTVDNNSIMFSKYSPEGQDFNFEVEIGENIETLTDNISEYINNFDVSYETYLWLDSEGHGTNGAPYDMKDVYADMEACLEMVRDLYTELLNIE